MIFHFTAEEAFKRKTRWTDLEKKVVFSRLKKRCESARDSGWDRSSEIFWIQPKLTAGLGTLPDELFASLVDTGKEKAYFELLHECFYESKDDTEREFALWAMRQLPNAIKLCFERLVSRWRFFKNERNNLNASTDPEAEISHYVKLLLKCDQYAIARYILGHINDSIKEKPSHCSGELDWELYAFVLDKLSIRPLLSFINDLDFLPPEALDSLGESLFSTIRKRAAVAANLPIEQKEKKHLVEFLSHDELRDKISLRRWLCRRKSLLTSLSASGSIEDILSQLNPSV